MCRRSARRCVLGAREVRRAGRRRTGFVRPQRAVPGFRHRRVARAQPQGPPPVGNRARDHRTALVSAVGRRIRDRTRRALDQRLDRAGRRRPRRAHRDAGDSPPRRRRHAHGRAPAQSTRTRNAPAAHEYSPRSPTRPRYAGSARAPLPRCSSPTSRRAPAVARRAVVRVGGMGSGATRHDRHLARTRLRD